MSGLFGSMSVALSALNTAQEALDVTTNNIANANTPGYAREVPTIVESTPVNYGNLQFGTGSQINGIQSVRDQVLDLRVYDGTQAQSSVDAYLGPMQQIQAFFNEASGNGLQGRITSFFSSWSELTTDPTNIPARQAVLAAGQNLAAGFNSGAQQITQIRTSLDQQVPVTVDSVNTIAQSIASLNGQIAATQSAGENSGVLVDQRSALLGNLSKLIDINVNNSGNGQVTISTAGGNALVVGNQSYALTVATDPASNTNHIFAAGGADITAQITGGQLGGTLQVRDQSLPALQTQLDTLASGIATAVNTAHQAGVDLNGNAGQAFFTIPATTAGTAASIRLNISDPTQIAASQSGAVGDNSNALAISDLQSQAIVNGQNPVDFYANTVSQLGNQISSAQTDSAAQDAILQQLKNQQSSIESVSLDEEAANLVQYQRTYQAAARVVSVIDQLTQDAINLGASTTTA